jgi:hypothetical protein
MQERQGKKKSVRRENNRKKSCEQGEKRKGRVLIDNIEKQRLDNTRAPCPNQQHQTQTGVRHTRRGLAKPKRARPPGTRAPLTGLQNTRLYCFIQGILNIT